MHTGCSSWEEEQQLSLHLSCLFTLMVKIAFVQNKEAFEQWNVSVWWITWVLLKQYRFTDSPPLLILPQRNRTPMFPRDSEAFRNKEVFLTSCWRQRPWTHPPEDVARFNQYIKSILWTHSVGRGATDYGFFFLRFFFGLHVFTSEEVGRIQPFTSCIKHPKQSGASGGRSTFIYYFIVFLFIFISLKYLIYHFWQALLFMQCYITWIRNAAVAACILRTLWKRVRGAYRSRWFSVIATLRPLHTLAVTAGGLEKDTWIDSFHREDNSPCDKLFKSRRQHTVKCLTGGDADWRSWYAWQPPGDPRGLRFRWLQE